MRIIKQGTLPQNKIYRGHCANCGAEFECRQHEGEAVTSVRGYASGVRVNCPTCGNSVTAKAPAGGSLIPEYTWDDLQTDSVRKFMEAAMAPR